MIINHNLWQSKTATLSQLQFDLENPRIRGMDARSDAEIISILIKSQDVMQFARSLVETGYVPAEPQICLPVEGARNKYIVLEGNRRLAAFKLLHNPALAPKQHQAVFKRLSTRMHEGFKLPKRLRISVVPSRAQANPYILQKHAAAEHFDKRWDKIQQAYYVIGRDPTELPPGLASPKARAEAKVATQLFELISTLDLPQETSDFYAEPSNFPYSALVERTFTVKKVLALLRMEITPEDGLKTSDPDFFNKVYAEALERLLIASKEGGDQAPTRMLSTVQQQLDFISSILASMDVAEPAAPGTDDNDAPERKPMVPVAPPPPNRDPQKPPPAKKAAGTRRTRGSRNGLFTPALPAVPVAFTRLRQAVTEIQEIDVARFPTATAVLMRVVFELAVNHHLESRPKWPSDRAKFKGPIGPAFSQMLKHLKEYEAADPQLGVTQQVFAAIKKFTHDPKEGYGPLDDLNQWIHNPHSPPTADGVAARATEINPLLRAIITRLPS